MANSIIAKGNMSIKQKIKERVLAVSQEVTSEKTILVSIETPVQESHGDYTTNVAMLLAKKLGKNPMEIAQQIVAELKSQSENLKSIEKIEVAPPGFINFWLSKDELVSFLQPSFAKASEGRQFFSSLTGKKIMVEYAHPNTHKEMHIGHMRTLITGEALSRLFEAAGAKVFRANYQGDIGPHVAKAMFGMQRLIQERKLDFEKIKTWSHKDKAHFLGEGYVRGNELYENEELKGEIDRTNSFLYKRLLNEDTSGIGFRPEEKEKIWSLYEETRRWSLDYYNDFYKRFYTTFNDLFFERDMVHSGKEIVQKNIGKVFAEENGAVIFPGEKYGLHTRVFITQAGNPTYEGKEMGNAYAEYEAFSFDLKMHIVASEQAGYFQVVFKALDLIDPSKFAAKQHHLSMGMVNLVGRKMSSRTGDVLTVDWLIDQVRARVEALAKEGKIESEKVERSATADTIEMITIGAIKYSVLKGGTGQNVAFDIEKSVSLEGNSGPYLQYTFARTQSVLNKFEIRNSKFETNSKSKTQNHLTFDVGNLTLEIEELALLRKLYQFEDVVVGAAENYAPNHVATYLFELAQLFNLFYQKHKVIGSEQETFRLALTESVGSIIQKGLNLLGIKSPEKM